MVDEDIDYIKNRIDELNKLLVGDHVDLEKLRSISHQKHGYINSELRSKIWPKLLLVDNLAKSDDYEAYDISSLSPTDIMQVSMDVERSLWNIDVTTVSISSYFI